MKKIMMVWLLLLLGGCSSTRTLSILVIGDSTVESETMLIEMTNQFKEVQVKSEFLGTLGHSVAHEGRGGWMASSYVSATSFIGQANPFLLDGKFDFQHYLDTEKITSLDVVILQVGINDIFFIADANSVQAGLSKSVIALQEMIKSINTSSVKPRILLGLPIDPNADDHAFTREFGRKQIHIDLYRNALKELRQQYLSQLQDVEFVNLNQYLDTTAGYDFNSAIHPNDLGYQQIAQSYVEAILK